MMEEQPNTLVYGLQVLIDEIRLDEGMSM